MAALPSVLIRISTGDILARTLYPRDDMGPVQGLDPDLEWCVIRTPFAEPNYDPRYYQLLVTEQRGPDPDAEFSHLHPWNRTFTTQKRPTPEIKVHAENKERDELGRHIREVETLKLTLYGLAILFRMVNQQQLTAREQAVRDRLLAIIVKLRANDDRLQEILTQLDANQEPDLETGWASE